MLESMCEWNEISIAFELWWKNVSEMGSWLILPFAFEVILLALRQPYSANEATLKNVVNESQGWF